MGDFGDACQTVSSENSNRLFRLFILIDVWIMYKVDHLYCAASFVFRKQKLTNALFFFLPCAFWHQQTNDSLAGKTGAIFNKAPLRAMPTHASGGLLHCELLPLRDLNVGANHSAPLWEAFVLLSFTVSPGCFHSKPAHAQQEPQCCRGVYTPEDARAHSPETHSHMWTADINLTALVTIIW